MKQHLLPALLLFAACASFGAEEESWNLAIKVDKKAKTDSKVVQQMRIAADKTLPQIKEKNEHITFTISIKNLSKQPAGKCLVKYAFFGDSQEFDGTFVTVKESVEEITLAASETATLEHGPVTFTSRTIDYPVVSVEATRDRQAILSAKSNSKEGVKYLGAAVAVYKDGKMIGSFVTPNELKMKVAKEGWKALELKWEN